MNNILPDKKFKKGDIVKITKDAKRWTWYREGSFRLVSYNLFIDLGDNKKKIINEKDIDIKKLNKDLNIHWLLRVKDEKTKKYIEYAEAHMVIDKCENRKRKIDDIISI